MKWTRLELAILAWFSKNTRSTTPRERHWLLTVLRIALVGTVLVLIGVPVALAGDWSALPVLVITGAVLFALGTALLIIAYILVAIISIIFGI